MVKYIGIRGHRGAGKNTISYLLGLAIEYYTTNKSFEGFEEQYRKAVDKIIVNPEFLDDLGNSSDFRHVMFDSFADTAKITLAQILGIPSDWMYNDWCKDATIIDMTNFSYRRAQNKLNLKSILGLKKNDLYTAEELYGAMQIEDITSTNEHVYITLRELIIYYSKYVIQKFFGRNVWVKTLENNRFETERFYGGNRLVYRIFVDCKFSTEISYIVYKNGTIVKVSRDNNVKPDTDFSDQLDGDNRFDFEIKPNGDLLKPELIEDIKRITLKIISE